ncbi:AAA family ATPase [Streptomyces sp. NPDC046985]|uniref:AAA family ATPase n=1 Tax=Streptomyces sp. NPDC046985 TaxID=3155377 RepID=UPI0033C61445
MQHAGGSPLPPHQPGHGPAAGWQPPGGHHPGGRHPAAHHPDPRQGAAPLPPQAPPQQVPPGAQGAPHVAIPTVPPVPQPPPAPRMPAAQPPVAPPPPGGEATGHLLLPAGTPVPMPSVPPAQAAPDATGATLAVLLIGPAGAGKTSVARHWAERRRVPTAHISLDDVREWVRSGFADPKSGWNDDSEAQYRLARRTCGFAARNFLANGVSCILDDAVFPDRPVVGLGGWKRHVGPGLLPVVLLPGLDVVLERNAERSGNRRLTDEEVARIHGRMAGWYGSGLPIIDNSQLDVPTTAHVLDEVLSRALASPPSW